MTSLFTVPRRAKNLYGEPFMHTGLNVRPWYSVAPGAIVT
jgi:hypothetical protein